MPAPIPPQPKPGSEHGSLGLGIGLAWACLVGGYTVSAVIAGAAEQVLRGADATGVIVLIVLLPWALMLGLIVWFAARGYTRTALGLGVGIGSIIGVALLLVAACFGIFSMH